MFSSTIISIWLTWQSVPLYTKSFHNNTKFSSDENIRKYKLEFHKLPSHQRLGLPEINFHQILEIYIRYMYIGNTAWTWNGNYSNIISRQLRNLFPTAWPTHLFSGFQRTNLRTILPGVSALLSEVGVGGVETCHTHSSHENFAWKPQLQQGLIH